jgi:catalase
LAPKGNKSTAQKVYNDVPVAFTSEVTDEDFVQPRALWEVFGSQERCQERFVSTIAEHVSQVKRDWLREEIYRKSRSASQKQIILCLVRWDSEYMC